MIRVTVDLVSAVAAERSRRIGYAEIANTGGTETVGSYRVKLYLGRPGVVWRECQVDGFPRKRLNAWDLLTRGLATILGDRNGYLPKSADSDAAIQQAIQTVLDQLGGKVRHAELQGFDRAVKHLEALAAEWERDGRGGSLHTLREALAELERREAELSGGGE